jgi:hypothetical protein
VTILFGGYNGAGGNVALGDTWAFANSTWTELNLTVSPSPRWGATMVYDAAEKALVMFGGRDATGFYNDTWEYNVSGWHNVSALSAPSPRFDYGMAYDAAAGVVVLYGGATGNNPVGSFTGFVYYNDTWTYQGGQWTNVTASAGPGPVGRLIRGQMAYDAAGDYLLLTGGYASGTACGLASFPAAYGETWTFAGGRWSEVTPSGASPPPGMGALWYDSEANEALYYEAMQAGSGGPCQTMTNEVWSYSAGTWTLLADGGASASLARIMPVFVDDAGDQQQLMFGGELSSSASEYFGVYMADTWAFFPDGNAPPPPVLTNSSWQEISATVGTPPSPRSISQAAYSPALNATILFGGYYGGAGNVALGDTWEFVNNSWTELNPTVSPSPRWGATMVYDAAEKALVMFGGRDATGFYNDTWEYNVSGWHNVTTSTAPSPRYDYGMAYDAAIGAVVLYGGGIGNIPAGTFTNFVFFTDTWTYRGGQWTNVTASAGSGPVGRLIRGQMAYDAADGYVLLAGGYSYVPLGTETGCGYVVFEQPWGATWEFAGGRWSEVTSPGSSPPVGMGVIWFDTEANETLYYEGMWLDSAGQCDVSGNQVWSYSAGAWTLVTEGNISAPPPREQPIFVDDQGDHEQLEFGGELASTASEYSATYLNDAWTYQPTWVTFEQEGLPSGAEWEVTIGGAVGTSSGAPILFVEAPGRYSYDAAVSVSHSELAGGLGTFSLVHGPAVVLLTYHIPASEWPRPTPAVPPSFPGALASGVVGAAVGTVGVVLWVLTATVRQRARWRREGEELVEAMVSKSQVDPPFRRP